MPCNYTIRREGDIRIAVANCEGCNASSSILDGECRKNIMEMIGREANIDRIILNHPFVKVFEGQSLSFLKDLADFVEGLKAYGASAAEIWQILLRGLKHMGHRQQI